MKIRLLLIALGLLGLICCSEPPPELPIEEDKLVKILADVHIAEAALQNLSGEVKDSTADAYYQQIAQRHKIDRALLDSTIILIRKDAKRMSVLYTKVLEE